MLQLRRITSGASWIPQIDGLRFVAIISVLAFHAGAEPWEHGAVHFTFPRFWTWIFTVMGNGDRGVGLFFVISGYILARPFLRQHLLEGHPVKIGAYFLRRLTRLEPPYILSLLIFAMALHHAWHEPYRALAPDALASMAYAHNLIFHKLSPVNFVTWSLEIEVQFYILAPLLGNLYRIRNTALRRSVFTAFVLLTPLMCTHLSGTLSLTVLGYSQYFFAGFLLADLLEYPRHAPRQYWLWDLVSLALWPAIFLLPHHYLVSLYLPILIIPAYLAAFHGKVSNWFFRQKFIALTGGMCYSIYLMHMLFISTSFRVIRHIHFAVDWQTFTAQMTLLMLASLLGGTIYFVFIERPCMDPAWPQKLWAKLTGASGPSQSPPAEPPHHPQTIQP